MQIAGNKRMKKKPKKVGSILGKETKQMCVELETNFARVREKQ